ncbi:galactosyl transferase GMA12/MNN10 domain protein [Burkholderia sp. SRS-W-2-2016]|uniref:galactosyl transferase GMA12/MNN10 domain protein n=1 Tax=Burkholderia sp. SRS-W-2-2016 TaxID=1926878 RepID=UPI00094B4C41|nr:galactosyl transferase GMA12/MNN10 domain protein [Burkholderia sp. SRS-W-2-2016]OLL30760.1 galactosyl transferase GMA12/MNN10 domain protein [Burkholderia sp. SRS-W-2-2016]
MIVLSHFYRDAPASLANHRYYAASRGYRHEWVDASAMTDRLQLRCLYRYEVLLGTLRRAADGELVLLLSEDAAIVEPVALDTLMQGRDWLLVTIGAHPLPQVDVQIWRNTAAVRERVLQLVKRCRLGGAALESEAELFAQFDTHHYMQTIDGVCPVMQTGFNFDPAWSRLPTFAVSIDDATDDPRQKGACPRFRNVLVEQINWHQRTRAPLFSRVASGVCDSAGRSTYNPGRPIALMMLYTPNIGIYAGIAERNFRRYCELHGYTLYVYREIPREIGLDASGNWFKPWLLHGYMEHHEWVVWLDADVLIGNMEQKLEPLMEGRDLLLAHNVGQWAFNSGVMGFRRTARNATMLHELMGDIGRLHDTSSVYASDGDQLYFIRSLERSGQLDDAALLDLVALNTPWQFRRPDSFIVHYYGMWTQMRALMMAHDEGL